MAESKEPVRIGVTEVARRLQLKYHRARDLMLAGKLGATEVSGRHLTVLESKVEAYQRELAKKETKK